MRRNLAVFNFYVWLVYIMLNFILASIEQKERKMGNILNWRLNF
jgi:hypothetical protein